MICVALVDDHKIIRTGLKVLIENNSDIKVVLEACNGLEFIDKLSATIKIPNIVILDLSMPKMNGHLTMEQLKRKYPFIQIIVYSMFFSEDIIINAISKGAKAFVNKGSDPNTLIQAIRSVNSSGYFYNEFVNQNHFIEPSVKYNSGFLGKRHLTRNEIEFIKLAATEMTYNEIARKIGKSPKTLENYRENLFKKLEVKNRVGIVIYAYKTGLIEMQPPSLK